MNIKLPAVYDISHYKEVRDFSAIAPRPFLMITKATEGTALVDDKFIRFFDGMKQAGILLGCYHFFRKASNPTIQATHFIQTIEFHVTTKDILILDVEEGGETAAQLIEFCDRVQNYFPENIFLIYSRKNILDLILMTEAQKARLRQIHIWTAGYPANPEAYSSVPSFYIPDPTRWGSVWLWQYSESGSVSGIEGAVDLNWIAPEFYGLLQNNTPPPTLPADIVTSPFTGVKQIHGERYGRRIYVNVIDPQFVRIEVCNEDNYPSVNCKKYGAQIAWNGDDWDRATRTVKNNPSPSLLIFPDGYITTGNHAIVSDEAQHTSGLRYLMQNGINTIPFAGTEPKYTERHARSIMGVDLSGKLIHLTVDGEYPDKGTTLYECAQIMLEFGAFSAFDQGGGGDSVEVLSGKVINIPDDNVGEIWYERKVPQTILVYTKEISMTQYSMTPIKDGTRMRKEHDTYATVLASYSRGQLVVGDEVWIAPADGNEVRKGDSWLKVLSVNGVAVSLRGWIAIIHKGETICNNFKEVGVVVPPVDPPPAPTFPVSFVLTDPQGNRAEYIFSKAL
jgi:lysozyme